MKTLNLSLKAKWYEMIEHGEKREEYREIKPYWITRFFECPDGRAIPASVANVWAIHLDILARRIKQGTVKYKNYTNVCFSYGYTKRTMTFKIESITVGLGSPAWGAPIKEVIIIKLSNKIQE